MRDQDEKNRIDVKKPRKKMKEKKENKNQENTKKERVLE